MTVVITEWGLQSYLDLLASGDFSTADYWQTVRPDVEKLKAFPNDQAFSNSRFWGPATDRTGKAVPYGYKMKWHNLGNGRIQLRVNVAIIGGEALLCRAYSKTSDAQDKREAAKFKDHIQSILSGNHQRRGVLP